MGDYMSNQIVCDECKETINIKPKRMYLGRGIHKEYIECNNCKERYTIAYKNKDIEKRIKRINKLRRRIRLARATAVDDDKLEDKEKHIANLITEHDQLVDKNMKESNQIQAEKEGK